MADQISGILSPWLRQRRLRMALPHVKGYCLDMGCGVGVASLHFSPTAYLGVDIDEESIRLARLCYPSHRFLTAVPEPERFDSILLLAVIEHLANPQHFLTDLRSVLVPGGRIVITTPHPAAKWIHEAGARLGLFSQHAAEQHQDFIDKRTMLRMADTAGLRVLHAASFLLGVNQLFVLAT
jgi:2-polyprenyl-3-methyl-5-hydroxy-6-metoxy-1,4-benzoquinol methylase